MPIYEYRCLSCGEKFSLLQKMAAVLSRMSAGIDDSKCPHCGSTEIKKLFSAFSCSSSSNPSDFTSFPKSNYGGG